jgi:hypothetical protein
MKAMCVNWKEYESTAGPVTFCELAAFNKKAEAGYLETIGCTAEKRKVCAEKMEMNGGFGLVPEAMPLKKAPAVNSEGNNKNKGVEKMKKVMLCPNWNEYEGLNGTVMFCRAGAYGKKLTAAEAKNCGCTALKREACLKAMITNNGFGLVPEVSTEVAVKKGLVKEIAGGMKV